MPNHYCDSICIVTLLGIKEYNKLERSYFKIIYLIAIV
jgi:hypothetical protein